MRPQLLAVARVVCVQDATRVRHKQQIAAGREQARERRLGESHFPLLLAADGIARTDMTVRFSTLRIAQLEVRTDIELGHGLQDRRRLDDIEIHAPFLADLVVEAGAWVVGAAVPADAAGNRRAEIFMRALHHVAAAL